MQLRMLIAFSSLIGASHEKLVPLPRRVLDSGTKCSSMSFSLVSSCCDDGRCSGHSLSQLLDAEVIDLGDSIDPLFLAVVGGTTAPLRPTVICGMFLTST